jgi:SAM-dependent methyltransferase
MWVALAAAQDPHEFPRRENEKLLSYLRREDNWILLNSALFGHGTTVMRNPCPPIPPFDHAAMNAQDTPARTEAAVHARSPDFVCLVCGSRDLATVDVLSDALIRAWELRPDEIAYINRQQGLHCRSCNSTLRCMALASAIHRLYGWAGTFADFVRSDGARALSVLEINEAGGLASFLDALPARCRVRHPDVDMQALPLPDRAFDLVVHSDTLEHLPDPRAGLAECRRVLRTGGACAFTVPIIVARLTRSRADLPPSYHGTTTDGIGYLVHTEFGADAWRMVLAAGFAECRIVALDSPAAHALVAIR